MKKKKKQITINDESISFIFKIIFVNSSFFANPSFSSISFDCNSSCN